MHGYRMVAHLPRGRQWVTVPTVEEAVHEARRLGWDPDQVELYRVEGREDEPDLERWSSPGGLTFSEVLAAA